MDGNIASGLDPHTQAWLLDQIEIELAQEVTDVNMGFFSSKPEVIEAKSMSKAVEALKRARGAVGRVTDDVVRSAEDIAALENHVRELNKSVTAPQVSELGAVKAELEKTLSELRELTNGPPVADPTKPAK